MALLDFNPGDHDPLSGFETIPTGDYDAVITASEFKTTNAGTGEYLKLTVEILGPTHKGQKVWQNLNLRNPNPVAVDIANRELSAVCDSAGIVGRIQQTEELHDKPLVVRIKHEQYKGEPQAVIGAWLKPGGAKVAAPVATPAAAAPAAPTPAQATPKPWET